MKEGKVRPLGPAPELTEEVLDRTLALSAKWAMNRSLKLWRMVPN